ncbi:amino acid ABC transporter ATP-binding protein [Candidatus Dependentiae bacterium]|nr:amino acid ABC transporter ATP-binding protein [Candidatus Dependentiae bacterium]
MLEINHLSKFYHSRALLNDISLTVKTGEIALFLGSSGVGKSTLLRILNNLEDYTQGTIVLDGVTLTPEQAIKKHLVGMVFQQFNLFDNMTVERNITFPLERAAGKTAQEAQEIAHKLLITYGLADKKQTLVTNLSGGQKQRLALARSLALKPRVLCLDEPTSALDPLLTSQVAASLQDLARQGYIVLIATHDTVLIDKLNCTIYLMENGALAQTASSQDFILNKDAYPDIKKFVEGS